MKFWYQQIFKLQTADGIPELEFIVMYGFVEHLWSILLQMEFIFQQKKRQQKNGAFQFIRK